jgi:GT2 family glycosyltransferase
MPQNDGVHAEITVLDPSGAVIARSVAATVREDLVTVGEGRVDFGFRVDIPDFEPPGQVRLLADGTELPGSPLSLGEGVFDGELTIADGRVRGWVSSREAVSRIEPVLLFDQDGTHVATLQTAHAGAPDDPFFNPAWFDAPLPPACFGRAEVWLAARVGVATIATASGAARLNGYLDALTDSMCRGWLFSPDAPVAAQEIEVYRDGVLIGGGTTGHDRYDVRVLYPEVGACGFEIGLRPGPATNHDMAHLSFRLSGSDAELFDGPFLVGSKAEAMQNALEAQAGVSGSPLLREAVSVLLHQIRGGPPMLRLPTRRLTPAEPSTRRITVAIPVYGDAAATRVCIDSVLRERQVGRDAIVLINDNPDDLAIAALLEAQARHPDVYVLRNAGNLGFIGSVNRALSFIRRGDVLLLNADTELYAGALDELSRVLHASADIGTVTALSNNATLFSYPHPTVIEQALDDTGWADLAAVALRENAAGSVTVPTAHGFCMLIRRDTLDEVGQFDTSFGRGYGEENDFSLRASDRGWRHVVAGGVLVRHVEAASFGPGKATLVAANLRLLNDRFPEYAARIDRFATADDIRRLRWPLDLHRMRLARRDAASVTLVIENGLDGGSQHAAQDIRAVALPESERMLRLVGHPDGSIQLTMEGLRLLAVFRAEDVEPLFKMLQALAPDRVVVHHLLGFDEEFVRRLGKFMTDRLGIVHIHDFYYACPRVTLIDALGAFCGGAASDRCARCVAMDGTHTRYRMQHLTVADHRALFADVLAQARHLIAPSNDAADRMAAMLPGLKPAAVPHPQTGMAFPIGLRRGSATDFCVPGAIGPHKGSASLLALARFARLNHPAVRFHVVGYTNIDRELLDIGNVTITGEYERNEMPRLIEATHARIALFLHGWPETFSYTLSEAVGQGLIPLVPDIGAPAERVRAAGFGVVYPFPVDPAEVMRTLLGVADGTIPFNREGGLPLSFDTKEGHGRLRALYQGAEVMQPRVAAPRGRRQARGR